MARCTLERNSSAPARARAFVREHLAGPTERIAVAELLVSELITNAVIHAWGDPEVRILKRPAGTRIEVHDASNATPVPRAEAGAHGGWGLHIVALLADRWGTAVATTGKVVWFEMDGMRARRRVRQPARARRRRPAHRFGLRDNDADQRKADTRGV